MKTKDEWVVFTLKELQEVIDYCNEKQVRIRVYPKYEASEDNKVLRVLNGHNCYFVIDEEMRNRGYFEIWWGEKEDVYKYDQHY